MVGLPETGKTTYLAALWHVVETADVDGALCLRKLHGDRRYLDAIRDNWLSFKETERTKTADEQMVSMVLKGPEERDVELFLPDIAGESFDGHWTDRRWEKEFDDLVQEVGGALLFVHPRTIVDPHRIETADSILEELQIEEPVTEEPVKNTIKPFDSKEVPTQVKLVELLQFIETRKKNMMSFNISIIVSAWDLVEDQEKCPERWLANRLPLLSQYLKSNDETFLYRVFGVSAQGGDLKEDIDKLTETMRPSDRIKVRMKDQPTCNNITLPIKNLMA